MRKTVLLIFSVLILGIVLFLLNLNTILNTSVFKNFLSRALKAKYHIHKITYDRVEVSLEKQLLKFDNLSIFSPKLNVTLKKVQARLALKKLLHFKSPIKAFYIDKGSFIYISKPFQKKKFFQLPSLDYFNNFLFLEPLHIKFSNLNLAIKEDRKLVSIGKAEGELRFENGQLLFEGKILRGEVLNKISLKGRFNYASSFFESSLLIKDIDFGQIPVLKDIFNSTDINFQARITLEKGRLDLLFFGDAPKVLFKHVSDKIYSCAYFQGMGFFQNGTFEVKVNPIKFNFPKTEAKLVFSKKKSNYKFLVKVPAIKVEEVLPVVELFLPEKVVPYFKAAKRGIISDFEFSARSPVLKTLFRFSHLSLKGKIREGEYTLPFFGGLPFSNFNGELSLENNTFKVKGNTQIKGIARIINSSFELKKEKCIKIALNCRIKGDLEKIKKFLLSHWKIFNPIEKYKPYGNADIIFNLSYTYPFLVLSVKSLTPLKLTFPQLKGAITLYGASLTYHPNMLFFYIEKIVHNDFLASDISGKMDFDKRTLETKIKKSIISKRVIQNFWNPDVPILVDYNFSKLVLENFTYKGPLHFDIHKLDFKGKIYNLCLLLKKQNKKLKVKSPFIEFQKKDAIINFSSPKTFLKNSVFKVNGSYKGGNFTLYGNAKIAKKDFKFLETDVLVKNFIFKKQGEILYYKGTHFLNSLKINLNFNGTSDKFVLIGSILGFNTNFNFKIQKSILYKVNTKGILALNELNFLFPKVKIKGKIISDLVFSFKTPKYEIEKILNNYLLEKEHKGKGFIKAEKVRISFKDKINLGFDFDLKVVPWGFSVRPFAINVNKHKIVGSLSIKKRKGIFLVSGKLEGSILDLSSIKVSKKGVSKTYWKYIKKLPISADLKIKLSQVILPTYHQIKDLNIILKYYEGGSFFVSLNKAKFCTLALKGVLDYSPDYKYMLIQFLSSSGDFLDLFSCLYPRNMPRVLLEGPFEGKGFIYSDGEKSLWENPYGELIATSKKGYLYRAPLLVKVLGYLSPIDIFKGKIPNLENDLLEYEELEFKGVIEKPYFDLKELFLSAPGFRLFGEGKIDYPWSDKKVDVTFYVSPFKTLDVVLEKIPVVRKLLGKTRMFIYLPIQVVGTYEHPKIIPLHPESVGKGISEFFLRLFGLSSEPLSKSKKSQILEKIEKKLPH